MQTEIFFIDYFQIIFLFKGHQNLLLFSHHQLKHVIFFQMK